MRGERTAEILKERFKAKRIRHPIVLGPDDFGGKLSQAIKRFVRQSRAANHSDRVPAVFISDRIQLAGGKPDCLLPGRRNELTAFLIATQRRAEPLLVVDQRMA